MWKARVKSRPTTSRAMRVDQRPDLGLDARPLQRLDDEAVLPRAIEAIGHMLGCAASAILEPAAERRGPLGALVQNFDQLGTPPGDPDMRPFARQSARHGYAVVGEAVAARVEGDDCKVFEGFSHGARQ